LDDPEDNQDMGFGEGLELQSMNGS